MDTENAGGPEETNKEIDIYLFSNGQEYSPPRKYHLNSGELKFWEASLSYLARSQYGSLHSSIDLYELDGRKVQGPNDIRDCAVYVAVVPPDPFIHSGYDKYLVKASRSWERRFSKTLNGVETTTPGSTRKDSVETNNLISTTAAKQDIHPQITRQPRRSSDGPKVLLKTDKIKPVANQVSQRSNVPRKQSLNSANPISKKITDNRRDSSRKSSWSKQGVTHRSSTESGSVVKPKSPNNTLSSTYKLSNSSYNSNKFTLKIQEALNKINPTPSGPKFDDVSKPTANSSINQIRTPRPSNASKNVAKKRTPSNDKRIKTLNSESQQANKDKNIPIHNKLKTSKEQMTTIPENCASLEVAPPTVFHRTSLPIETPTPGKLISNMLTFNDSLKPKVSTENGAIEKSKTKPTNFETQTSAKTDQDLKLHDTNDSELNTIVDKIPVRIMQPKQTIVEDNLTFENVLNTKSSQKSIATLSTDDTSFPAPIIATSNKMSDPKAFIVNDEHKKRKSESTDSLHNTKNNKAYNISDSEKALHQKETEAEQNVVLKDKIHRKSITNFSTDEAREGIVIDKTSKGNNKSADNKVTDTYKNEFLTTFSVVQGTEDQIFKINNTKTASHLTKTDSNVIATESKVRDQIWRNHKTETSKIYPTEKSQEFNLFNETKIDANTESSMNLPTKSVSDNKSKENNPDSIPIISKIKVSLVDVAPKSQYIDNVIIKQSLDKTEIQVIPAQDEAFSSKRASLESQGYELKVPLLYYVPEKTLDNLASHSIAKRREQSDIVIKQSEDSADEKIILPPKALNASQFNEIAAKSGYLDIKDGKFSIKHMNHNTANNKVQNDKAANETQENVSINSQNKDKTPLQHINIFKESTSDAALSIVDPNNRNSTFSFLETKGQGSDLNFMEPNHFQLNSTSGHNYLPLSNGYYQKPEKFTKMAKTNQDFKENVLINESPHSAETTGDQHESDTDQFIALMQNGDIVNLKLSIQVKNMDGILKTTEKINMIKSNSVTDVENGDNKTPDELMGSKSLQSVESVHPHLCCRKNKVVVYQCACCNHVGGDKRPDHLGHYYLLLPIAEPSLQLESAKEPYPRKYSVKEVQTSETLLIEQIIYSVPGDGDSSRKLSQIETHQSKDVEEIIHMHTVDTKTETSQTYSRFTYSNNQDQSTQTNWCDVLLEAREEPDGHYTFYLPPLHLLRKYTLHN